ncbi:hypothetical protein Q4E93_18905 [Flavitalea sp. BT771]|uniref:hypothetical protein n=1 Tax=Flavitalea sp. BT771 TaxID=3063329 RepID=UPI0026E47053|nr:hypothetical protein [Flavitalea sp. BT771]MDO6432683.1 hypothetical protein [Flavitalea sp. BT771]MDV6222041.1 hypothetical protein [Flavitalea sp. BT771]
MIFFEFSFRIKVSEDDIFPLIKELYPESTLAFYPHAQFYNEEMKCPPGICCFVYEFLYAGTGFKTFLRGEIYNEDQFSELPLAISAAKRFEMETVIADFTGRYPFLLITPDGTIYRTNSIGIGDPEYKTGVFEIDYGLLSPAVDLSA